jgi:hypothetical protein
MPRPITPSDTCALLRRHLARTFPDAAFTVSLVQQGDLFAIRMEWTDGPASYAVFGAVTPFAPMWDYADGGEQPGTAWLCEHHDIRVALVKGLPDGEPCCAEAELVRFTASLHLQRHVSIDFEREIGARVADLRDMASYQPDAPMPGSPPGTTARDFVRSLSCSITRGSPDVVLPDLAL